MFQPKFSKLCKPPILIVRLLKVCRFYLRLDYTEIELSTYPASRVTKFMNAKYILFVKKGTRKVDLILPTIDCPNDPTAIIARERHFGSLSNTVTADFNMQYVKGCNTY